MREEPPVVDTVRLVPATTSVTPPAFGSVDDTTAAHRSSGVLLWFVAAAALVAGIVIGFTSGYTAGQRGAESSTTTGRTFSEAAVAEPVRVDPPPIVTPDDPPAPIPAPAVARAPAPVARPSGAERRAPAVAAASTAPGSIEVLSRPAGAQVILDGRVVGRTPLSIPNVREGTHDVRLELPGFNRWATSVDVNPGMRARVAASLEQTP